MYSTYQRLNTGDAETKRNKGCVLQCRAAVHAITLRIEILCVELSCHRHMSNCKHVHTPSTPPSQTNPQQSVCCMTPYLPTQTQIDAHAHVHKDIHTRADTKPKRKYTHIQAHALPPPLQVVAPHSNWLLLHRHMEHGLLVADKLGRSHAHWD